MLTIGLLFWILMVLWAIFGVYIRWGAAPPPGTPPYYLFANDLLVFVLFLLLGIHAFGWPIRG